MQSGEAELVNADDTNRMIWNAEPVTNYSNAQRDVHEEDCRTGCASEVDDDNHAGLGDVWDTWS